MEWRLYAIAAGIPTLLGLIGLAALLRMLHQLDRRLAFASEFRDMYLDWIHSGGNNQSAYEAIILRSSRMQSEMGTFGVMAAYKPAFANYTINNYQIIVNMIPELMRSLNNDMARLGIGRDAANWQGHAINEAILRYLGSLEHSCELKRGELKNPLIWLRTGLEQVAALPLFLLVWLGLIASHTVSAIQGSWAYRAYSALVALITVGAAIVTVLTGWEQSTKMLMQFWNKIAG